MNASMNAIPLLIVTADPSGVAVQSKRSAATADVSALGLRRRFARAAAAARAQSGALIAEEKFPSAKWEAGFQAYTQGLAQVRDLGNRLRPISLRERDEVLAGAELADEVLELFAA